MVFGGLNRGGSETSIMNVYRNIDRSKFQFDFVSHSKNHDQYTKEIESLGGKVFIFPKYKFFNHYSYHKSWTEFLKKNKYDIIHIHYYSVASIILNVINLKQIKTIVHSHTANVPGLTGIIIKLLNSNVINKADYLLACSKKAGVWFFGKKVLNKNNFFVANNGLQLDKFQFDENIRINIRNKYNLNGKIVFGHIGRFSKAKNHEFLIRVFVKLSYKFSNLILFLIGEGENKVKIFKLINQLKIYDKVIHIANVKNVNEFFQTFDFFIFPSIFEGFGNALIESQVNGLISFTSKLVPNETFLTDKIVLLKKPYNFNIKSWVNSISGYINVENQNDRYISIDTFKDFDILSVAKWYSSFYDSVI